MTRFATTFIALILLPLAVRADSAMSATLANDVDQLRVVLTDPAADVNSEGANGLTALHVAAAYGYCDITSELLAAGAQVDARDHLGNTPLILAAQEGQVENALLLLTAGADRDARSLAGGDAMSYARGYGHRELVAALAPVVPTPSPMRNWPYIMAILSIALLAAILSEIHRSVAPKPVLARVIR